MPNLDDWERIRRDRTSLLNRCAGEVISQAPHIKLKFVRADVDQQALQRDIEWIVQEYLDLLKAYKQKNLYGPDERVQPTKIAAFLGLLVASKCPIRMRSTLERQESYKTFDAIIANAYLAWRVIQSLLRIDCGKMGDDQVEYLIRCLHNVERNSGDQPGFVEDWGIMLMESMCSAWGKRLTHEADLA